MEFRNSGPIPYYQRGDDPKLVIHSGTHGDEYHIVPVVIEVIEELKNELPDFQFVSEFSPSAVAAKTRRNAFGNDANRGFGMLTDPEVTGNKKLLEKVMNAVGISFHEDLGSNQFYVYDSSTLAEKTIDVLRGEMKKLEIPLFDGIDDPDDPALSYYIRNGYVDFVGTASESGAFVEDWAIYHGYLSRYFTFEIPYNHPNTKECIKTCVKFGAELAKMLQL